MLTKAQFMNTDKLVGDLLHAHGLRKTQIRVEIIQQFMASDFGLRASEIINSLKANHDRVTVYRALNSFEENGIIHKASEDANGVKYALCGNECSSDHHEDTHAHFVCDECQNTFCLDDVKIPQPKVSDELTVNQVTFTINGICKECKA